MQTVQPDKLLTTDDVPEHTMSVMDDETIWSFGWSVT